MAAPPLLGSNLPIEVFNLEVRPGEIIPCISAPYAFRVTMAALDPSAPAQPFEENPDAPPRATLKIIRHNSLDLDDLEESDEDSDDSSDVEAIERRLGLVEEDESDESGEGPSDPEKVKKARQEAAAKKLTNGVGSDEDEDIDMVNGVNGTKVNKGKKKVTDLDDDDDDDEEEEDDEDDEEMDEEFVLCTLDTSQHYQQPLDLSITDPKSCSFQVTGTHSIYLTGNYFLGPNDEEDSEDDDDDDDYEDQLNGLVAPFEDDEEESVSDGESDELDGLEDPRIKELGSDEEEEDAPKLVKALKTIPVKGKNKRPAESDDEEGEDIDSLIKKTLKPVEEAAKTNGEPKLSKKQLKKLKKNDGQAAPGAQPEPQKKAETKPKVEDEKKSALKDSPGSGKKVQFAKNLEQGPTASPKVETKGDSLKKSSVKVVQGITLDDRKQGTGSEANKGDRVAMRYIGKLEKDGKQFDANKKGPPFKFKVGAGEVIKGWDLGIVGMKVGGERRLTVPAQLAYGSKGVPGIPPNSTLVFDVKLLSIN